MKDFKDVFPESLPLTLPPNRGISDIHRIETEQYAKPVYKTPYKTGPHENAIIK